MHFEARDRSSRTIKPQILHCTSLYSHTIPTDAWFKSSLGIRHSVDVYSGSQQNSPLVSGYMGMCDNAYLLGKPNGKMVREVGELSRWHAFMQMREGGALGNFVIAEPITQDLPILEQAAGQFSGKILLPLISNPKCDRNELVLFVDKNLFVCTSGVVKAASSPALSERR